MLSLQVIRPKEYVTGRTQSYRLILRFDATDGEETRLFVCSKEESGVTHLESLMEQQYENLPDSETISGFYRQSRVDLVLPSKELADLLVAEVANDVQQYLSSLEHREVTVSLDGATI